MGDSTPIIAITGVFLGVPESMLYMWEERNNNNQKDTKQNLMMDWFNELYFLKKIPELLPKQKMKAAIF